MYDFANSSYTTVVITAVFNAYFVAAVAGGQAWATMAWTGSLAVANKDLRCRARQACRSHLSGTGLPLACTGMRHS